MPKTTATVPLLKRFSSYTEILRNNFMLSTPLYEHVIYRPADQRKELFSNIKWEAELLLIDTFTVTAE